MHTAGGADPPEPVDHELDRERLPEHLDRLFRAAVVMTGSRHEAEDLVQETFVRVLRRPRLLRRDDDLAYLMRTMRNAWLNIRRRRGAEARAVEQSATLLERQSGTRSADHRRGRTRCWRSCPRCRRSTAT